MTIIFIDSFDHYVTADLTKKWTTLVTTGTIDASTGRRSTSCFRTSGHGVRKSLGANYTTILAGAAVQVTSTATAHRLFQFGDAGSFQCGVYLNSGGTLSIDRNTNILGTSSNSITAGSYYFIELKCTINDTTGSAVLRVNGTVWLTVTNVDNKTTANAYVNELTLWGDALDVVRYDDLYVANTSGSAPTNDFLGDCRVDMVLPNADGTYTQFTPSTGSDHYAVVDDASPNTTDYNSGAAAGDKDSYNMTNLSTMTGTIYAVQAGGAVAKDDAGARSIKVGVRSSSTDSVDAGTALSTSQLYYSKIHETDPATAAAWTESGVNAAQTLFEVV